MPLVYVLLGDSDISCPVYSPTFQSGFSVYSVIYIAMNQMARAVQQGLNQSFDLGAKWLRTFHLYGFLNSDDAQARSKN